MTRRHVHPERGMTLTEVMIVMALASLVMLGLVGFYMTSQAVWMEGSSQAITQRDATLLVAAITDSVRRAARANVADYPDAQHQILYLYADSLAPEPFRCFYWKSSDSRVYSGSNWPRDTDPLVVTSAVSRFQLGTVGTKLVLMDLVELPTSKGPPVRLASAAALYNR
jgi:prepilin-type N-terminal cleavage/methylation domain-containing protein